MMRSTSSDFRCATLAHNYTFLNSMLFCLRKHFSCSVSRMPQKMPKKVRTKRLNAPADEDEVQRFMAACERVGIRHTDIMRGLAAAFADCVEQYGRVIPPLRLVPPPAKK